jgi:hypothetical protein
MIEERINLSVDEANKLEGEEFSSLEPQDEGDHIVRRYVIS